MLGIETSNVGNRLKRVLAKFRADRSHPRGVNGRSKFRKNSTPKTSNGRKIARIAPIWTKIWQNRSQRWKLSFRKFCFAVFAQKPRENFAKPSSTGSVACAERRKLIFENFGDVLVMALGTFKEIVSLVFVLFSKMLSRRLQYEVWIIFCWFCACS